MTARAQLTDDDPRHGTLVGYGYHRCRCERCRTANTIAQTRLRRYTGGHAGLEVGRPASEPDSAPMVCDCDLPAPDAVGECGHCHRLVLTHSFHHGRPPVALAPTAVEDIVPGSAIWDGHDGRFYLVDANPKTDGPLVTLTVADVGLQDYERGAHLYVADSTPEAVAFNERRAGERVA